MKTFSSKHLPLPVAQVGHARIFKSRSESTIVTTLAACAIAAYGLLLGGHGAQAGGKITIDETKWISVGAGARASFRATEDDAPNGSDWSNDFNLDNARIYINGQIHEKIAFEMNTECLFCGGDGEEYAVLDAIAKFNFDPSFNIWAGRMLTPAHRQELNGPFYSPTYDAYKMPFYSSDFSTDFGTGGAGVYARDHGVNVWGNLGNEGALQYLFGVFSGLQSSTGNGPNQDDELLYAGRVAYNFLNVEKNPGYYTSGTYYGGLGDILTVGLAAQYQEDGAGSFANPGDFFGYNVDVLFEKDLGGAGVLTLNGEYKDFDADYDVAAFGDGDCFCMFDGDAYSVTAMYLLPNKTGWGRLQPYVRWTDISPDDSSDRDEFEAGLNYIIDGHNARVSVFYQHGDLATKGLNYAPGATGESIDSVGIAVQLQL